MSEDLSNNEPIPCRNCEGAGWFAETCGDFQTGEQWQEQRQCFECRHTGYELLTPALAAENARLSELLKEILATTISHVDGRDLLAELHPRKTLDIKRRVDGIETWFEADWLSNLYNAVKKARAALGME